MGTHTYGPRTAPPPAPRVNRYAGICLSCGNRVGEGEGTALQIDGKWKVQHLAGGCPPRRTSPTHPQPELGYYVRSDGEAIKVVNSKRMMDDGVTPRRYGLVFTTHGPGKRPSWDYVKGAGLSIAHLRPMTAGDAAQLGLAHGHCINCCAPLGGSTLSSQVSALIGYGETCAGNLGWPYPKGVAAQRQYILDHE